MLFYPWSFILGNPLVLMALLIEAASVLLVVKGLLYRRHTRMASAGKKPKTVSKKWNILLALGIVFFVLDTLFLLSPQFAVMVAFLYFWLQASIDCFLGNCHGF
jgi:hypothetical protein